jgi:hypothetical protein
MDVDKNLRIMAIKMTLSTIVPINVMYVLEFTIFHAASNARVLS